jgi:hypothetical protein
VLAGHERGALGNFLIRHTKPATDNMRLGRTTEDENAGCMANKYVLVPSGREPCSQKRKG